MSARVIEWQVEKAFIKFFDSNGEYQGKMQAGDFETLLDLLQGGFVYIRNFAFNYIFAGGMVIGGTSPEDLYDSFVWSAIAKDIEKYRTLSILQTEEEGVALPDNEGCLKVEIIPALVCHDSNNDRSKPVVVTQSIEVYTMFMNMVQQQAYELINLNEVILHDSYIRSQEEDIVLYFSWGNNFQQKYISLLAWYDLLMKSEKGIYSLGRMLKRHLRSWNEKFGEHKGDIATFSTTEQQLFMESVGSHVLFGDRNNRQDTLKLSTKQVQIIVDGIVTNSYKPSLLPDSLLLIPEIPLLYMVKEKGQRFWVLEDLEHGKKLFVAESSLIRLYELCQSFITGDDEFKITLKLSFDGISGE